MANKMWMAMLGCVVMGVGSGIASGAAPAHARRERACTDTATALFAACKAEGVDDAFVAKANCINVADAERRDQCLDDLKAEQDEHLDLCRAQRAGRIAACDLLGEGRYDPSFDPSLFDDPHHPTTPNPYFPLAVGDRWEYRGEGERNTVEVLDETKQIVGVTCAVVLDQVFKNGELTEDTDDWFCHRKNGDVWYFGEETKDFENFSGDAPPFPELVSIDGSFKNGRDGSKGGLFVLAAPTVGAVYLEEFSLANAEDVTEILSITYAFGHDATLDQAVPPLLAARFCANADCVVTKNYSLLEPGAFARKYYAKGVGVILEVEVDPEAGTAEPIQLVACNFDPRCENPPMP